MPPLPIQAVSLLAAGLQDCIPLALLPSQLRSSGAPSRVCRDITHVHEGETRGGMWRQVCVCGFGLKAASIAPGKF